MDAQEFKNNNNTELLFTEPGVILPFEKNGEYYIDSLGELPKKPVYEFIKRLFDLVASTVGLIVTVLPMLIIAILVKGSSPGPVLFKQERLGKNGEKFNIVKFRTMVVDAEKNGAQWCVDENEDPRLTKIGRVLRKLHIDEVPQLWCIFTGHMSFVGPRPERECFYEEFETYIHGFSERLKVKPGLTGHAQVNHKLKPEEKILFDIEYIQKRSLWVDLELLIETVFYWIEKRSTL